MFGVTDLRSLLAGDPTPAMPPVRAAPVPPVSPYAAEASETPRDARPWLDVGSYHDMVVVGPPVSPRAPPPIIGPGPGLWLAPHGCAAASPPRVSLAPLLSGGFGITQRFYPGPAFGRPAANAAGNPDVIPEGVVAPASPMRGASLGSACSGGFERMVLPQARAPDALGFEFCFNYCSTDTCQTGNPWVVHEDAGCVGYSRFTGKERCKCLAAAPTALPTEQPRALSKRDCCMCMQALLQEELGRLSSGITSRIRAGLSRQRSREDREGPDAAQTASGASSGPNPDRGPLGEVPEAKEDARASGDAQGAAGAAGSWNDPGPGLGHCTTAPEVLPPSRRASGAFGSSIFVSGSPSDDSGRGTRRGPSPRTPLGSESPSAAARALPRGGNGAFGSEVHLARDGSVGDDNDVSHRAELTAPLLEGTGKDEEAGEARGDEQWFRNRLLLLLVAGYGLVAFLFNIVDEACPAWRICKISWLPCERGTTLSRPATQVCDCCIKIWSFNAVLLREGGCLCWEDI